MAVLCIIVVLSSTDLEVGKDRVVCTCALEVTDLLTPAVDLVASLA